MKKIIGFFILIGLFCFINQSYAAQQIPKAQAIVPRAQVMPAGPKKVIAVARFKNKTNWTGQINLGTGMADQLITALMNSGRFIVIERGNIQAVLREQDFAASGRTTKRGGAKIGKLTRAQILIQGAITEFGYKGGGGSAINIKGFSLGGNEKEAVVGIDLRIYDTTTGQVLASKACRGTARASGVNIGYVDKDWSFASGGEKNTPIDFAVRSAITQALDFIAVELDNVPWQGRIAMVKDNVIYINVGRTSGITAGEQFTVYKRGEPIIDPDSGISLGAETTKIGRIEVVKVREKFSKTTPVSGSGFSAGDIIKFE